MNDMPFSDYWVWWYFGEKEKAREKFNIERDSECFVKNLKHICFASYKPMKGDYFVSSCFNKEFIPVIEGLNKEFNNAKFNIIDCKDIVLELRGEWDETTKYLCFREPERGDKIISFPLIHIDLNGYTDQSKKYLYYIYSVMIRMFSSNEKYLKDNEPEENESSLDFIIRLNNEYITKNGPYTGHLLSEDLIRKNSFMLLDDPDLINKRSPYIVDEYGYTRQTRAIKELTMSQESFEYKINKEKEYRRVRDEFIARQKQQEKELEERMREQRRAYVEGQDKIHFRYDVYLKIGERSYFLKSFENFTSAKKSCIMRSRNSRYNYIVRIGNNIVYSYINPRGGR